MSNLYRETEYRLYNYQNMIRDIEAFEAECTDRQRTRTNDNIKGTFTADPTAKGGVRMAEPPNHINEKRMWVGVIRGAWAEMETYEPEKARIIEALYGLGSPKGVRRGEKGRIIRRLMGALNIGETTVKVWRRAAVNWVKEIAIYNGLLDPRKSPD